MKVVRTIIITNRKRSLHLFLRALFVVIPFLTCAQESGKKDTLLLKEVEVFGKQVEIFPIQPVILKNYAYVPIRDVGDFLRKEPNISGIRKGGVAIDPVVRGFKYNQVSVLQNSGVKIEGGCPNRMDPVVAHVENEDISQIEVIKGPYVLQYGPVLGAMINIKTVLPEPLETPGIHGKVLYGFESNWNGQREHVELTGGNNIAFFRISGGFKNYGNYTAGNAEQFNTSFKKSYATAVAGFQIRENHRLTLSYAYNQGNNIRYPALPMDERIDKTHVGSIQYAGKNLGKILNAITVQGYISPVHHVMDNLDRPTSKTMQAVTTVDAWNAGGKITGTWKVGKHQLLTGLDFEHIYKDGQKKMTMQMVMSGDPMTSIKYANVFNKALWNNAGLFGEYQSRLGNLDFSAAVRLDYNQANSSDTFRLVREGVAYFDQLNSEFLNFSFSAGVKKMIIPELFLTLGAGLGTRSPSILERFIKLMPVQYDAYDYLGNPQLKPEQNYQVDLTFDYYNPALGSFSVNGFFSLVHHYILGKIVPPSVIKPSTQGAPGVKQFSNIDQAYLGGFEFRYQSPAQKKWGVTATAGATFGTNPDAIKYLVTNGQVTGEEVIKNDPLPEIPPLEGSVQVSYKFWRARLIPRIMMRAVNAQNRVSEAYQEQKTPGFVTAGASVNFLPFSWFSMTAGVENILDNPYYEHLNRRIVGSTEKLYEPGRVFYINLAFQF